MKIVLKVKLKAKGCILLETIAKSQVSSLPFKQTTYRFMFSYWGCKFYTSQSCALLSPFSVSQYIHDVFADLSSWKKIMKLLPHAYFSILHGRIGSLWSLYKTSHCYICYCTVEQFNSMWSNNKKGGVHIWGELAAALK